MQKEAYTIQEVASLLGLHINSVYRAVRAGKRGEPNGLDSFRVGRSIRVSRRAIDKLLEMEDHDLERKA